MNEDREEREDQRSSERGWDALETEDEERLIPIERFEKTYPPILPQIRWRSWFKNAAWIFLACVPIAIALVLLWVFGSYP